MAMTMGVIGVQHPHGMAHLLALEGAPEVERLLIWDEDREAARQALERLTKGELADSPETLIGNPDLPAVCVLLRDREAGAMTHAALQAGQWVYGDKPGAYTAAELASLVEAGKPHGVHFCPCYANRVLPITRELTALLQGGAIGRVWSFSCQWITSQVSLRGPENWLFHREQAPGGILTWLGSHWLDLLRVLLGCEVAEVTALTATQTEADIDVEDVACLALRFTNGAVGALRAGYLLNPFPEYDNCDYNFQFEGSQGGLTWYPRAKPVGYRLRSSNPAYSPFGVARDIVIDPGSAPVRPGYAGEFLAAFLAAVEGRGEVPATEVDAWQVLKVIEAAYESAASGRKVCLL